MMRGTALAVILLIPWLTQGATLEGQRNVVLTEAPAGNTYLAGSNVAIIATVPADLTAAGANVVVSAPVAGDVLIAGGTLDIEQSVAGDVRAAGARIIIDAPVAGDIAALGGVVLVNGRANDVQVMGGTVRITGGADGSVSVYGSDVFIAGEYAGDVEVSASDRVTVADGTVIHGAFRYNAPQTATIASTATATGGIVYTGAASYLPSPEEARRYAIAGAGVFFLVKALAALVVTGLVVGLFPRLSKRIVERALVPEPRPLVLRSLLGLALIALMPMLLVLLAVSFVGIGIALIGAALYFLLIMLSYVYAGLLVGSVFLRIVVKRHVATWKAAILGMLLLYLTSLLPIIGGLIAFAFMLLAAGTLALISYEFAWKNNDTNV